MIIFVKHMRNYIFCFLSALLLSVSWPVAGFSYFIFFAFVPLLFVLKDFEKNYEKAGGQVFWLSFLTFLIFNILTTYWVYYATLFGAIMAFLINSFLMSFVFYLFHKSKNILGIRLGYLSLVIFWVSMEYLHLNWDLSWPWLTLGNCFSESLYLINWYEYTGVLGGSIWVLLTNILFFVFLNNFKIKKNLLVLAIVLFAPILASKVISKKYNETIIATKKIVIVQPNVDPYTDKFSLGYKQQLKDFVDLARTKLDSTTDLLIGPETALLESLWESKIEYSYSLKELEKLQRDFPKLNILLGATTFKRFNSIDDISSTARQIRTQDLWYDVYNSAIFISNLGKIDIYHKVKLVPGAEKIPFPFLLNNISSLSVNLGGVSGSLGSDNYLDVFSFDTLNLLPLICYESIFGDLNKSKDFDLMCIITNDGWWKNTSGYKQHFSYSKLRALEQRKSIIRCANTGQSGVINSRGEVIAFSDWNEKVAIDIEVSTNNIKTFYNKFGDYIGRISSFTSSIFLLLMFVKVKLK